MRSPRFLGRDIADIYALARVHGDVRHGERQGLWDGDDADTVIVNGELLLPHAVHLFRLMNFDFFNQLIEHPRGQLSGPRIFADGRDKHIRRDSLAFGALHSVLQGFYFIPQLFLFRLILGRHPCKSLIGDLARYIVLVEPLKQVVQLLVAVR